MSHLFIKKKIMVSAKKFLKTAISFENQLHLALGRFWCLLAFDYAEKPSCALHLEDALKLLDF